MIEARGLISDIDTTRKRLVDLGAEFICNYAFKDIIFVPKQKPSNLSADFVRARVYTKSDWPTKKVVLTRKQTTFSEGGKTGKTVLKKEFDAETEADAFVSAELGTEFERGFEYEREGWQYAFRNSQIFVEDIKGFKPSIEIEADSPEAIEEMFSKIGVLERVRASMPEVMRRILAP